MGTITVLHRFRESERTYLQSHFSYSGTGCFLDFYILLLHILLIGTYKSQFVKQFQGVRRKSSFSLNHGTVLEETSGDYVA